MWTFHVDISLGHFILTFHWDISLGHFIGTFHWDISLGHFISPLRLPGIHSTERTRKIQIVENKMDECGISFVLHFPAAKSN